LYHRFGAGYCTACDDHLLRSWRDTSIPRIWLQDNEIMEVFTDNHLRMARYDTLNIIRASELTYGPRGDL
jgi:hypothetical protein